MSRKLLLILVLGLVVASCTANEGKHRKHKKVLRKHPRVAQPDIPPTAALDDDASEIAEREKELRQRELDAIEVEKARMEARAETNDVEQPTQEDACARVHCGAGRSCALAEDGRNPICKCVEECAAEKEPRRKVCTNHNETWPSDCHVYQKRCWCDDNDPRCDEDGKHRHVHIEYYGECREMPDCTVEEMSDFPRRMADWLFNVMRELADRKELSEYYLKMEREAEENMASEPEAARRRWAKAAVWKWCDLDGHPHDRTVSRHELFPIRAPLMSLEHCIAPFLDGCDADDDHRISLKEWAKCLNIDQEEIEDQCEEINDDDD